MFNSSKPEIVKKIVLLNPKGGCGKTTLATNLASYFALLGPPPTLLDYDPNGYSMRWLEKRDRQRPPIHGIGALKRPMNVTQSWHLRIPDDSTRVIIDTPAALGSQQIHKLIYDASNVIIPVLPSAFDIRVVAQLITDLALVSQFDLRSGKIAVVANRTRSNTCSLNQLVRFLNSLHIPVITSLRDSQNYVYATGQGIGVYEMPHYKASADIADVSAIINWLEKRQQPGGDTGALSRINAQPLPSVPLH